MVATYNNPNITPSSISSGTNAKQMHTFLYIKKALFEAQEEQYFMQLADVTNMPKNMGKSIKMYHYIPMLDDENINTQGIDPSGVTIDTDQYYVTLPQLVTTYAVEADATAAAAAINACESGVAVKTGSASPWTVTASKLNVSTDSEIEAENVRKAVYGAYSRRGSGNLYGSSTDIGTIVGKLPRIGEMGGRVNRVGLQRKELEGTMHNFGFFHEWTEDSVQFDSDEDLEAHINRELINGASEMTEDALQIDLLNAPGVIRFAGSATNERSMDATSLVSYRDLMHLGIDLDNNETPKHTTIITGTRNVDTKTIPACRVLYVGSEMLPTLKSMKDLHNNPAFIEIQKYAGGTTPLKGEVGSIDNFRIVVVPKMLKWANAGSLAVDPSFYAGDNRYDVFPMLCVGEKSFTTIGFQTDGKTVKFTTIMRKPGAASADREDPFGKKGFASIQWWYGFLAMRPERIGLIKTVAKM